MDQTDAPLAAKKSKRSRSLSRRLGQGVRRLGRWIGWSPWMTAVLAVLLVAGLLVVMGVTAASFRWLAMTLCLAFLLFHFFARAKSYLPKPFRRLTSKLFDRLTEEKQPSEAAEQTWFQTAGFWLFFMAIVGLNAQTDSWRRDLLQRSHSTADSNLRPFRQRTAPGSQVSPSPYPLARIDHLSQTNPTATRDYWQEAAFRLYEFKFAPVDDNEELWQRWKRVQPIWKAKVAHIRALSTEGVDPDLVQVVRSHLEADEAYYLRAQKLADEIQQDYPELRKSMETGGATFSDAELIIPQIKAAVARGDIQESPDILFRTLAFVEDGEELVLDQYIETREMQARLQERYPPHSFELPDVDGMEDASEK